MNKPIESAMTRLKKMLINDKVKIPNGVAELLRNDIIELLDAYFEFDHETFNMILELDSNGTYHIKIDSSAKRIRPLKLV